MTQPPLSTEALKSLNAQLDRKVFELESLLKAGEVLQAELDVSVLCSLLIAMVRERVAVDHLAVLLHDPAQGSLTVEAVEGLSEDETCLGFPADPGILWSLLRAGQPFSVLDLEGAPRFPEIFDEHGLGRLQGQLWIPLNSAGQVVGILSLGTQRDGGPVPESEHTFLCRLASRAALAIHTARLYTSIEVARRDLDRSLHQLSLLFDVTRALGAVSNLTRLLKLILERSIEAVGAEKGSLMLFDDTSEELVMRVVYGLPDKEVERRINDGEIECKRFKRSEGIAGKVLETGQAIRVDSTEEAGDFTGREDSHVRSLVCVPMRVDDEPIGVINITNKKDGLPFANDDAEILGALADQAGVAIARARLYEAAITDGLTGLYVRRFTLHRLREEIKRSRRYGDSLGVVMCDIDHFKSVNDSWGHPSGDAVLRKVAEVLRSEARVDVDVAGRYGGEEFLIVLPQTNVEGSAASAERMRSAVDALAVEIGSGRSLRVTMSFGVTELGADDSAETLLARADAALYEAKSLGRNRVVSVPPPAGASTESHSEEAGSAPAD